MIAALRRRISAYISRGLCRQCSGLAIMCWIASQAKTVNRRGVPTPKSACQAVDPLGSGGVTLRRFFTVSFARLKNEHRFGCRWMAASARASAAGSPWASFAASAPPRALRSSPTPSWRGMAMPRPSPPGSGSDSVTAAGRKNLRQKTSS